MPIAVQHAAMVLFLRRFSYLLAGLYLAYVAGVFIFLSTPLFERIVTFGPHEGSLNIESGWSLWPGRVELRGVRLEIEDPNVHLKIHLPSAQARVDLAQLPRRRVEIARFRTNQPVKAEMHLRTDPERYEYGVLKGPGVAGPSRPWTLRMRDVELAELHDLSLDRWRFRGSARARGAFELTPGVRANIEASELEISRGAITDFAHEIRGTVRVRFAPFSVPDVEGSQVFRYLDARLALYGELASPELLNELVPSAQVFRAGAGPFFSNVRVSRGLLQDGSRLRIRAPELVLELGGTRASGKSELDWEVARQNASLELRLSGLSLTRTETPRNPLVSGARVLAHVVTPDLDLLDPFRRLEVRARFRSVRPLEARRWNSLLPLGIKLDRGQGSVRALLLAYGGFKPGDRREFAEREGYIETRLEGLSGKVAGTAFQGENRVRIQARIPPLNLNAELVTLRELEVHGEKLGFDFGKEAKRHPEPDWWFTLHAPRGVWNASVGKPSLRVSAELQLKDSWPAVEFLYQKDMISSIVYYLALQGPVVLGTDLELRPAHLRLGNMRARLGPSLRGEGELQIARSQADGAFLLRSGILSLGLSLERSKMDTTLFAGSDWLREHLEKLARPGLAGTIPSIPTERDSAPEGRPEERSRPDRLAR